MRSQEAAKFNRSSIKGGPKKTVIQEAFRLFLHRKSHKRSGRMTPREPVPGFHADLQIMIKKYPELELFMLAGAVFLDLNDDGINHKHKRSKPMKSQEPIPGFRADLQTMIKKYPELKRLIIAGIICLKLDENEAVALSLAANAPLENILEHAILWMRERAHSESPDGLAWTMGPSSLTHIQNDTDSLENEANGDFDNVRDRYDYPHSVQVFIDRERARMHQQDC
jgi:hypothetical protein